MRGDLPETSTRFDLRCPELPSYGGEPNMLLSVCTTRRLRGGGCHGVKCSAIEVPAAVAVENPAEPVCSVEGCEVRHYAKGLCQRHYSKSIYKPRPRKAAKPKAVGCSVVGCHGRHEAKGLCVKHYRELRNRKAVASTVRDGDVRFSDRNWAAYHTLLLLADRRGVAPDDLLAELIDKEAV